MKRVLTVALTVFTLSISRTTFAGQFYGGNSYLHTNSAVNMAPGGLDFAIYDRGYVGKPEGMDAYVVNGTSAFSAAFGFSRHLELGFTQILYQDLNSTPRLDQSIVTLIPGNTYIRFKFAGYPYGNNIYYGGMAALRYRVGLYQNVHMEPYQSEAIEIEIGGIASYFVKPLFPDEAPSFHLNLNLLNHNDADSPTDAAQEVNFLASSIFPRPRFDFGAELYGAFFYIEPVATVLGRENWMYVTPFVRYKLFKNLSFTLGFDLLMMGGTDSTVPTTDPYPNYPGYRIAFKIRYTPPTAVYSTSAFVKPEGSTSGAGRKRGAYSATNSGGSSIGGGAVGAPGAGGGGGTPMFNRQELFRWGIEERGGEIQSVDLDLEKLRIERKKAEEELNALKAKLEERQKNEQK